MLYKNDEFQAFHERRITSDDPYFENISDSWSTALRNV
jgi:predicted proteasome-type protease